MEEFFIAMVPMTLFLTIGGVLIFRPLTKRLGLMLEASARNRRDDRTDRMQYEQIRMLLEAQNLKIDALEQRLEFTECLLENRPNDRFAGTRLGGRATASLPEGLA